MATEKSTKVVTGKVRFSYVHVFEPSSMNEGEEPKYSVCLLIPKKDKDTLKKINDAIKQAEIVGKDKLSKNGKIVANYRKPLRDGDEERDTPEHEGCFFINVSSKRRPGIVDKDLNAILDKEEFYSGCYGRASINFFAYNSNGSRGITAGLNNVQKLSDGEPLAGGTTPEEDFADEYDDDLMG